MQSVDARTQDPQSVTPASAVRIVEVATDADRSRWRPGFIGAYQTIFARAPYFERFTPADAEGVWRRLTSVPENITMIAAAGGDRVAGFGVAIPLRFQRDVSRELSGLISDAHTFYLAELGVLPEYRHQGLGKELLRARLARINQERYRAVVLRASAARAGDYSLYKSMGFEEMGVSMDVPNMRVDGRVTSDRRVFLHCVISQIRLD
jgi:ribosomal protein S18 acetylase RimI-like enzyme